MAPIQRLPASLTPLDAALAALLQRIKPVTPTELALADALGCVAAQMSPLPLLPSRDVAAGDGWALRSGDPAIDAMIAVMLEAREHRDFVSAVRALDRVLMSGFYAIPLFNVEEQWIARWNRIERPKATSLTGYLPETWWQRSAPQSK
jgi:hypothetical protein